MVSCFPLCDVDKTRNANQAVILPLKIDIHTTFVDEKVQRLVKSNQNHLGIQYQKCICESEVEMLY